MTNVCPNTWGELVAKWHREGSSVKRIAKKTGLRVETIRSMLAAQQQKEQDQPSDSSKGAK